MKKAGRPIHPDDLPPALRWEASVWWLYVQIETQWRYRVIGMEEGLGSRRSGLDYGPAIALAGELGWSLRRLLPMLKAIELTAMENEATRGE